MGELRSPRTAKGDARVGFGLLRLFLAALALALVPAPSLAFGHAGDLDPTFGADGLVTTDITTELGTIDQASATALQPDGKIVVAGDSQDDFALARCNSDGSLDTSFGSGGRVLTDFGQNEAARAVALQPDGRIVVAGYSRGELAVARYEPDGSLDPTFSGDGKVTTDLGHDEFRPGYRDPRAQVTGSSRAQARTGKDQVRG